MQLKKIVINGAENNNYKTNQRKQNKSTDTKGGKMTTTMEIANNKNTNLNDKKQRCKYHIFIYFFIDIHLIQSDTIILFEIDEIINN